MNRSSTELRIDSGLGALVLIGPSAGELSGLGALLEHPGIEGVEAIGTRMASWITVSTEVIEVGRSASSAIRNGRTAVVYLDSHVGEAPPLPIENREFVCTRMGQILIGLADPPSYVLAHGEHMARSLIFDSLDDPDAELAGLAGAGCPIWRLSEVSMFSGAYVAMCPGDQTARPLIDMLAWFEARRS